MSETAAVSEHRVMNEAQDGQASRGDSKPVQQQVTIAVDDRSTGTTYANFFRVTSTPEEVVLDLGLNAQAFAPGDASVKVDQRVVMNFFTAKRLLGALSQAVQRHEQAFGVLETDVLKRVRMR